MWTLILTAFTGCSFGFMFGAIVRDERSGLQTAQMFTMMFSFGGGNFVNLGPGANWFVKLIGHVSPYRYTSERLMRTLLKGRSYVDAVCDYLDYTYHNQTIPIMFGFACGFFTLSWVVTIIKAKFFLS